MLPFNLLSDETHWVFISGSDETHDLLDIEFGLTVLGVTKVPGKRCHVFVDDASKSGFGKIASRFAPYGVATCLETQHLSASLQALNAKGLVIVVAGHGCEGGIGATPTVPPYQLKDMASKVANLEVCLIVLGQCYSGVFNFIEAETRGSGGRFVGPRFVLMGATSFTTSWAFHKDTLDLPQALQAIFNKPKYQNWLVNFFLLHFFLWVLLPDDIDGDGNCSVMDAYKRAAVRTAECMLIWKTQKGLQIFQQIASSSAVTTPPNPTLPPAVRTVLQDAHEVFRDLVSRLFANQEPWILNAWLARELVFR